MNILVNSCLKVLKPILPERNKVVHKQNKTKRCQEDSSNFGEADLASLSWVRFKVSGV